MIWTVWYCCGNFEIYDSEQEALSEAVLAMNSDGGHQPQYIEAPDGNDIMDKAHDLDSIQTQEYMKRVEAAPKIIGAIHIAGPNPVDDPRTYGVQSVYSEAEKNREIARYTEIYGADRVSWKAL